MTRKMVIPSRFIRRDSVAGTVAIRGRKGRFKGRKKVKGKGDKTTNRRLIRSVDVNHDGKIDFRGGTVWGRNKTFVKGSKRARGYQRTI